MNTLHQGMPATGGESFDLQALTRALLESALNAIMDEQADMACEGGANSRNGYRERGLVTPVGKITLRIPKLRCGTYFPEGMLERYSRADKTVAAAVAEMYANAVSTRKVERICKRLDAEVAALRAREFGMARRTKNRKTPGLSSKRMGKSGSFLAPTRFFALTPLLGCISAHEVNISAAS